MWDARPWLRWDFLAPAGLVLACVLFNSAGAIQAYETAGRYDSGAGNWPIPAAQGHEYADLYKKAAIDFSGRAVAFGFQDRLFNVNTISLYQKVREILSARFLIQIDPIGIKSSQGGVSGWLTEGGAASVCFLVLSDEVIHQFPPTIPVAVMEAGVLEARFSLTGTAWMLPDGERLTLWRRGGCG